MAKGSDEKKYTHPKLRSGGHLNRMSNIEVSGTQMQASGLANAARLARGSLDAGLYSNASTASFLKTYGGMLGIEPDLLKALGRSGKEVQAVRDTVGQAEPSVFLTRVAELARSQAFFWTETALTSGERLGNGPASASFAGRARYARYARWSRQAVIGTMATDLYLGYAGLRYRERLGDGLSEAEDWEFQHQRGAFRVLEAASSLGGALIKAGQFASTRPDLLPEAYIESLSTLQDQVPALPWSVVERTLNHELGRPFKEVFATVEPRPIAAASVAQVHRARLRDGRWVALKIRYPDIEERIEADLGALETVFNTIATLEPGLQLHPIVEYLRWTLPLELDFYREARELVSLKEALADRDDVLIPEVVGELSTGRLLVMDLVEGIKITDREALIGAGIDPAAVASLLNDLYADQIYARRYLHADPHPGNLLVQAGPSGPRLVVLDHGLTLPLEPEFVGSLEKMVRAVRQDDFDEVSAALKELGVRMDEGQGLDALLQLVGVLFSGDEAAGEDEEALDLGGFTRSLGSGIAEIPPKLLLVGRAIGFLDGIGRQLDPELDALEIVDRYTRGS